MKRFPLVPLLLAVSFAFFLQISAQAQDTAANSQTVMTSLATLPESDAIIYVNASRILNEAMPRLVPEKEMQDIRSGLEQLKAFTNIDLKNMEFMIMAVRFNKPAGGVMNPIPQAIFITRGDFDAKALLGMATMMSEGKLKEEAFGSHSLHVLKLGDISSDAAKNPFGAAFAELAAAALDGNTLVVGNLSYVKAALDAADGNGRIKPETLSVLLRNPNVLMSVAGSPMTGFAKSFGLRMADHMDTANGCGTRFGDFYVSLDMDAQNFRINGAMNADNPDTASMMRNMFAGYIQQGKGMVPDKDAQAVIDQLKLTAEGSEVLVEIPIPQEMAARFIRDMFAPKKPQVVATSTATKAETKTETKATTTGKKSTKSRRRTRTTHSH
jgi:hypothetical protein